VPWALLLRAVMVVGKRWTTLSSKERARFTQLVRQSRGRASNLSVKQRLELRKLARKLDLKGIARDLGPLARGGGRGRRRRRG
jgi:hypothetical protein